MQPLYAFLKTFSLEKEKVGIQLFILVINKLRDQLSNLIFILFLA
jgi:hypothetical protein